MALFQSSIITAASGSVGGITYSHNKGGMYIRSRVVPTNPNTTAQIAVRNHMSQLANRWESTLTQAQRDAWNVYAANVTVTGPLGDTINLSGINHYIRSNMPRRRIGEARIDAAPTVYNIGEYTLPVATTLSAASQELEFTFTTTDDWVDEDLSFLIGWISRPQNPGVTYFRGPYQYAGKLEGDSVTPPTSPHTFTPPFTYAVGQRCFFAFTVSRADARYSARVYGTILCTT